jgi:chorismate-pyruvate lyase
MPKNWNKLTLSEQETWLIKKYQEVVLEEQSVKRMLAQVRGKVRVQIVEEDYRPDIEALKGV